MTDVLVRKLDNGGVGREQLALLLLEPAVENDELFAAVAAQPQRVEQRDEPGKERGIRDRVVR